YFFGAIRSDPGGRLHQGSLAMIDVAGRADDDVLHPGVFMVACSVMMRAKAAGLALAASFSIYAIPLFGRHVLWFLGEVLFQGPANMSPRWKALNVDIVI